MEGKTEEPVTVPTFWPKECPHDRHMVSKDVNCGGLVTQRHRFRVVMEPFLIGEGVVRLGWR